MPRPLAVLLDLDGTLVDTLDLLLGAARHTFRDRADGAPTEAEWRAGIGTPLRRQLAPYARDDEELAALVAGYRAYQHEHHDRLTTLYDGAAEVIALLHERGHPLAVVTSKSDAIANRTLGHVALADRMAIVVGTESSARHKPDPEPVRVALAHLDYAPHEAVFVGDSPHDVEAGRAAGVTTIAASWGFFSREALDAARPDHYIASVAELPALVERIGRG